MNNQNQDQGDERKTDSGPLANPTPPPDVDLDQLRGDRIGDTVYSGRWCIQTVMKLMRSNVVAGVKEDTDERTDAVDMEEELQNEVGALWDMTINVDVCLYLHSVGAVESICYIISNSLCSRATEMCVGMLANIITHNELWKILHMESTVFKILINQLTHIDQLVLLEVTRFFNTALCHVDNLNCYAILCENCAVVTQELMRIFSGSRNADLLKQAAELTYSLMLLDENELHFCTLFADADFVIAVVEASKELGYERETSGQNYLMEVFHYFTTYEAGAVAIDNSTGRIAETNIMYLRLLCQSLNLTSNTKIITSIIATLNHIFCRHMMVHVKLISSPSFIHCILKTLVAVYRKLGYYSSFICPKGRTNQSSKNWKTEDFMAHTKTINTTSWSERASIPLSTYAAFQTPDPSPCHVQKAKDLEISWSERRMSSPLVGDDFVEEKWKRPEDKKRLRRRENLRDGDKYDCYDTSKEMSISVNEKNEQGSESVSETESNSAYQESSSFSYEQTGGQDPKKSHGDATNAVNAKYVDRFRSPDNITKSVGFTDQEHFKGVDTENVENSEAMKCRKYGRSNVFHEVIDDSVETGRGCNKNILATSCFTKDTDDNNDSQSMVQDVFSQTTRDNLHCGNVAICCEKEDNVVSADEDAYDGFSDVKKEDIVGSSDGLNGDKYHRLLEVITEFLTEYFNSLRETVTREDGTPCIKDVMIYFNTQCSSVEIRAIVRCVGTSTEITQPLGRLLHMCDHFKAKRLKSVLIDYINRDYKKN